MKKLIVLTDMAATLLSTSLAHATVGANPELKIRGSFIPAACSLSFRGGGTIDYGIIPARMLNKDKQYTLPTKTDYLTLACNAPTLYALQVDEQRPGTAVASIELGNVTEKHLNFKFGLGEVDGKNIGAYAIWMRPADANVGTVPRCN